MRSSSPVVRIPASRSRSARRSSRTRPTSASRRVSTDLRQTVAVVGALGLTFGLGLGLAGCSLTSVSADACQNTSECRTAFGLGWACSDDGFCRRPEPNERCRRTFPANLLTDGRMHSDTFVIGAIADESVETHRARQNAVQLAFSGARDEGGVEGRPVGVVFCTNEVDPTLDTLDQAAATEAVVSYLADQLAVSAIVGPPSSGATEAAFGVASSREVLVISPSATSPALTDLEPDATDEVPGLLWRTASPDSLQGRVIADDLATRMVTSVALIIEDGSYGNGLAQVFESRFSGSVERFVFSTPSARNTATASAGSGSFDEVLFISSQTSDASAFLLFAADFPGYADKGVFLTDSAKNLDLLTDAGAASGLFSRVRGTAPASPGGTTYTAFLASYRAAFGTDPRSFSFTAHAYDAAWLVLLGATWASLQEPDLRGPSIARGLRRLSGGAVPVVLAPGAIAAARDRFRLDESINVEGASGSLDFDPTTEETRSAVEVWTIAADASGFVSEYEVTP